MPPLVPPVGIVKMYARDPLSGDIYQVGSDASPSEVAIVNVDPYVTDANSKEELWLDTSQTPPILKGRVNNAWVEVTAATEPEIIVGGTIPSPGEDKLWLDPGGVMTPPTPGDPIKKLWAYDGSVGPTQGWHAVEMGGSEVEVSAVDPTAVNPDFELWVDSSVQAPPPVQTDEVWVGPDDPRLAVPPGVQELWLDTSVTPPLLRYWDGTAWVASLYPYLPLAGGALTGPVTSSSTVTVAGAITANGGITMGAGDVIQFPNEASPTTKIVMYGTPASGFGHGVEGGNLTAFGSGFKFRQSSMTGTQWAFIDATCGGGRVITETNGDARYARNVAGRANSGFLSLPARNLTGSYASIYNTPISYPSGNRRIKVTVQLKVNPGGESHIYIKCFGQETSWTKHAVMADTIGPAVFVNNGATGTSSAVNVEVKSDIGSGNILSDASSWVLVEDLGPR